MAYFSKKKKKKMQKVQTLVTLPNPREFRIEFNA